MTDTFALDLDDIRALTDGSFGVIDVACPSCGPSRRSAANRNRKVLRIWDDGEFATYLCARCGIRGWAADHCAAPVSRSPERRSSQEPKKDKTGTARFLWEQSQPLRGSLAEIYLRSRRCFVDSQNLRFIPARGDHPPAMIARFGCGEVTGIHLTRLKPDGSGKAGTDRDKIMIGPSVGQPIVIQENDDRGDLVVTEGIEDAASFAVATGWSAWAAGAGGRIPAIIAAAQKYDPLFSAFDDDAPIPLRAADGRLKGYRLGAGPAAKAAALALRPDLIPVDLGRLLGRKSDANRVLQDHGSDVLLAALDWSLAQTRHRRGEIGFHAMLAQMAGPERVFSEIARGAA